MSQTDSSNLSPPPPLQISQSRETLTYEDEIDLIDYFHILWKQRWLILLGTGLPALLTGLFFYMSPRAYQISYIYNRELTAKEFRLLEEAFYSQLNLDNLSRQFQAAGFSEYASKVDSAQSHEALKSLVHFEVSPPFFDATKSSKALTPEELDNLRTVKSHFLLLHVGSGSHDTIREVGSIIRQNFEQQIPLISIANTLQDNLLNYKEQIAVIEESRFNLDRRLERRKSTLSKFKDMDTTDEESGGSNIVLQFDNVSRNSDYLPLDYQLQVTEAQVINMEEDILEKQELHAYYSSLLEFYQTLHHQVTQSGLSLTLEGYRDLLTNLLHQKGESLDPAVKNSLLAYIQRIDNQLTTVPPVIQQPKVRVLAKGTLKKTGVVFVSALLLSIFGALVREGQKRKAR